MKIKKLKISLKCIDSIPTIINSKKTSKGITIYSGQIFSSYSEKEIKGDNCFVAEKDGFTAHGSTLKKAVADMQFKIIAEKLKNEPIKEDTMFTVKYYRTITGACDLGCRSWMDSHGIEYKIEDGETVEKKPISAKDLLPLLEKSNAYGYEKFKSLVQF